MATTALIAKQAIKDFWSQLYGRFVRQLRWRSRLRLRLRWRNIINSLRTTEYHVKHFDMSSSRRLDVIQVLIQSLLRSPTLPASAKAEDIREELPLEAVYF
jgi:hypothetical protein